MSRALVSIVMTSPDVISDEYTSSRTIIIIVLLLLLVALHLAYFLYLP